MQRPTFADPKTDFTFKRIFGSEEHKDVLIAFLNDILGLDGPHRIRQVELLPPEQRPMVDELKLSIVDVKCTDERGVIYVVEMQVLQVEGFEKRVVYNVAKAYVNQIARGDPYPDLDDVVGITICDFEIWPDSEGRKIPMLSRWRMTEQHSGANDLGQIRLVFLELPKYDTSRPPQTVVEKWAYFFREAESFTVVPEALAEPPFVEALDAARIAGLSIDEWDAYIRSGMEIENRRGMITFAEKRGERRGVELGKLRGREEGLRTGIEALCNVLGVELTDARRAELQRLDERGLESLLEGIKKRRSWD